MEVKKICGIFAVATMVVSTFFVTSCNSEDDFDFGPDSQYSLAERKMTKSTEITEISVNVIDTLLYHYGARLKSIDSCHEFDAGFTVMFSRNGKGKLSGVQLISYSISGVESCGEGNMVAELCTVNGVALTPHHHDNTFRLSVSGSCACGVSCSGEVGGLVFF